MIRKITQFALLGMAALTLALFCPSVEHPTALGTEPAFAAQSAFNDGGSGTDQSTAGGPGGVKPRPNPVSRVSEPSTLFSVLAGVAGFVLGPDDRWKLLIGGFMLYFIAVHVVVFGDGRFHFPLIPFFAIYAAWFAVYGSRGASRAKRSR